MSEKTSYLLQSNSGSLEQLQCLSVIENKLMKDKLEAKSVKQSKIEKFFAKIIVPKEPAKQVPLVVDLSFESITMLLESHQFVQQVWSTHTKLSNLKTIQMLSM